MGYQQQFVGSFTFSSETHVEAAMDEMARKLTAQHNDEDGYEGPSLVGLHDFERQGLLFVLNYDCSGPARCYDSTVSAISSFGKYAYDGSVECRFHLDGMTTEWVGATDWEPENHQRHYRWELLEAMQQGDTQTVRKLIRRGGDPNATTLSNGWHPTQNLLSMALSQHEDQLARFLLENGATLETEDGTGSDALFLAQSKELKRYFLEHGASINTQGTKGQTLLKEAASQGDSSWIEELLERGADINLLTDRSTALHYAANMDIAKQLIDAGASWFWETNPTGWGKEAEEPIWVEVPGLSYLWQAAHQGSEDLVMHFLASGTNWNDNDFTRQMFQAAARNPMPQFRAYLLERFQDLSSFKNPTLFDHTYTLESWDFLYACYQQGAPLFDGIPRILCLNSNPNNLPLLQHYLTELPEQMREQPDFDKMLHFAAEYGQIHVMEWLVDDYGLSVDAYDNTGDAPLHISTLRGQLESTRWLLDHGANIHAKSKRWKDRTPLHCAVGGHGPNVEKVIQLLVERGADIHATMDDGSTVLHSAADSYNETRLSRIKYFLQLGVSIPENLEERFYCEDTTKAYRALLRSLDLDRSQTPQGTETFESGTLAEYVTLLETTSTSSDENDAHLLRRRVGTLMARAEQTESWHSLWKAGCKTNNAESQQTFAKAIQQLAPKDAFSHILTELNTYVATNKQKHIKQAISLLGKLHWYEAWPWLQARLHEGYVVPVAEVVGAWKHPEMLEAIQQSYATEENIDNKVAILKALQHCLEPPLLSSWDEDCHHENDKLKAACIEAQVAWNDNSSTKDWLQQLRDLVNAAEESESLSYFHGDNLLYWQALIRGLGSLKVRGGLALLQKLFPFPSNLQSVVIQGIALYQSSSGRAFLRKHSEDVIGFSKKQTWSPEYRGLYKVLDALNHPDDLPLLSQLLKADEHKEVDVFRQMASIESPTAIQWIARAMSTSYTKEGFAAGIQSLGRWQPQDAVDSVVRAIELFEHENQFTLRYERNKQDHRREFSLLAGFNISDLAPVLANYFDHENKRVRRGVVRYLGATLDPEWLPLLLQALSDSNNYVQQEALQALQYWEFENFTAEQITLLLQALPVWLGEEEDDEDDEDDYGFGYDDYEERQFAPEAVNLVELLGEQALTLAYDAAVRLAESYSQDDSIYFTRFKGFYGGKQEAIERLLNYLSTVETIDLVPILTTMLQSGDEEAQRIALNTIQDHELVKATKACIKTLLFDEALPSTLVGKCLSTLLTLLSPEDLTQQLQGTYLKGEAKAVPGWRAYPDVIAAGMDEMAAFLHTRSQDTLNKLTLKTASTFFKTWKAILCHVSIPTTTLMLHQWYHRVITSRSSDPSISLEGSLSLLESMFRDSDEWYEKLEYQSWIASSGHPEAAKTLLRLLPYETSTTYHDLLIRSIHTCTPHQELPLVGVSFWKTYPTVHQEIAESFERNYLLGDTSETVGRLLSMGAMEYDNPMRNAVEQNGSISVSKSMLRWQPTQDPLSAELVLLDDIFLSDYPLVAKWALESLTEVAQKRIEEISSLSQQQGTKDLAALSQQAQRILRGLELLERHLEQQEEACYESSNGYEWFKIEETEKVQYALSKTLSSWQSWSTLLEQQAPPETSTASWEDALFEPAPLPA